jgi:hypothetical protein
LKIGRIDLAMLKCLWIGCVCILQSISSLAQHKADGYKGIWFTLGQFSSYGDKYSGGLGTYTANHIPVAVYSKAAQKTFFVYGATSDENEKHLLIAISYFDHQKKQVPKPTIVYDKMGVNDPHDNASISIDDQGYIWVFVSGRNTSRPGLIFKSKQAYSIEGFTQISQGEMTYPQPWFILGKGFFYLFTKYTNGRELYWRKSIDGMNWTADQQLAGMGGHYQLSGMNGNKLVTVFNYHPGGNVDKRTNLYLLQSEDLGKSWQTIEGKTVPTPVLTKQHAALVHDFEKENKLVYLNDLNFDKDGNPIVLAVISRHHEPGPKGDPREWFIFHWKNGRWNEHRVTSSSHNYDMGSLYVEGKHWTIIGPTSPGPQPYGTGGEMVVWESHNEGASWKKAKTLTENSARNHSYARRPLNAHKDFYAFWADGNASEFSRSQLYFSNKQGDVFLLPYQMKNNLEKPIPLKKSHQKIIPASN